MPQLKLHCQTRYFEFLGFGVFFAKQWHHYPKRKSLYQAMKHYVSNALQVVCLYVLMFMYNSLEFYLTQTSL